MTLLNAVTPIVKFIFQLLDMVYSQILDCLQRGSCSCLSEEAWHRHLIPEWNACAHSLKTISCFLAQSMVWVWKSVCRGPLQMLRARGSLTQEATRTYQTGTTGCVALSQSRQRWWLTTVQHCYILFTVRLQAGSCSSAQVLSSMWLRTIASTALPFMGQLFLRCEQGLWPC